MPRLIYGTAWKKDRTTELVVTAIQAGFRAIDTACQPKHYFEPGVGKALEELQKTVPREKIFIQTKFTSLNGQDPQNIPYDSEAPLATQVQQSLQVSLKNLKTSYIDSLVLHGPFPTHEENMQVWNEFEKFVDAGSVLQIGISNFYELDALQELWHDARIKPAVLQNRFYRESEYDKGIRHFCSKKGIIYQSFWSLTANPHILKSREVLAMASKYEKTPAQVFFRFLMEIGIAPLTGTTNVEHMKQDLEVLDMQLTKEEVESIDKLLK